MHLKTAETPPHVAIAFSPVLLPPQAVGNLTIHYHPLKKKAMGYVIDTLQVQTNDVSQPIKTLYVAGTIREGTPIKKRYGRLFFASYQKNFGKVRAGRQVASTFLFENTGREALRIYEVRPLCDCVQAVISNETLPPGTQGRLDIHFDTTGQKGKQRRGVILFSDDPLFPMQRVALEGYVKGR